MNTSTERELSELRDLWSRFRRREVGGEAINFYRRLINPGDLCFDVGANVGVRTAILLEAGARVVAIEPQSKCVSLLQELFGCHSSVEIVAKGVGASIGASSLHVSTVSGIASMSSDWRSSFQRWENAEATWTTTEAVDLTTLDILVANHGLPRYIKIDVEGYELEVLSGLSAVVPIVSFEYHTFRLEEATQCIQLLSLRGDTSWNYTIEDGMHFVSDEWLSTTSIIDKITQMRNKPPWYGDIYVCFDNAVAPKITNSSST